MTREFAYTVYKTGEAVWREGASDLLSLHGFSGIKVQLCETYFAAKVKVFDMVFDQVFFVVNKVVHFALLGLLALMAARIRLLTVTGRDVMADINEALMLNLAPTSYQQKAVESLNCLADLMRSDPNQMDPAVAWEKLSLGEFGPQLNLLTELIQENPPQEHVADVLVDTGDEDEPPSLINILDDELPAAPSTSAMAAPAPLMAWMADEHAAPIGWTQMVTPFSSAQMASIH